MSFSTLYFWMHSIIFFACSYFEAVLFIGNAVVHFTHVAKTSTVHANLWLRLIRLSVLIPSFQFLKIWLFLTTTTSRKNWAIAWFLRKSNPWSVILWRHLQGKNYFHLLTFARFLSLCGCEFIDHLNNFPLSSNTYCMHNKMYCARSLSKIWMISIKNLMSIVFFVSLTWLPQRGVHYTVKYKPWNTNILFIS